MRWIAIATLVLGACHALSGLNDFDADGTTATTAGGHDGGDGGLGGDGGFGGDGAGGVGAGGSGGFGGKGGAGAALRCPCAGDQLVMCLAFEGNLNDDSGSSHSISFDNGTPSFAPGVFGDALTIAGDEAVVVAPAQDLALAIHTVEIWIHPNALPATRYGILDLPTSYGLFLYADGHVRGTGSATQVESAPGSIVANKWTHLALSSDGSTLSLRVDGAEVATTSITPAPVPNTLYVGANDDNGMGHNETFIGNLDQLRIFGRVVPTVELCLP